MHSILEKKLNVRLTKGLLCLDSSYLQFLPLLLLWHKPNNWYIGHCFFHYLWETDWAFQCLRYGRMHFLSFEKLDSQELHQVGVKHWTNPLNRGFAFGLLYTVMNVAAFVSGPVVDLANFCIPFGLYFHII